MKLIPLTRNLQCLVDDETYRWAHEYKWYAQVTRSKTGFVAARRLRSKIVFLHREIMQPPVGLQVDHINGDGLDNRRQNLRVVTDRQNKQGFRRFRKGKWMSRYRGVSQTPKGRWQARLCLNGKLVYLGTYSDEEAAARARDAGAIQHYGEYAALNFPKNQPTN